MIFSQRTAEKLIIQYLTSLDKTLCCEARSLFLQEYGWANNTITAMFLLDGEHEKAAAVQEIMLHTPITKKHQVVDCSGGQFGKIGEALNK